VATWWDDNIPDEHRLLEQLLCDCDPDVRPIYNSSQPVSVYFQLGIYQIVDLVWRVFCSFCLFSNTFINFYVSKVNRWVTKAFNTNIALTLICVCITLCSFVPHWLLFNYRMYCRGAVSAFKAWLLLIYSQFNICFLMMFCFDRNKLDDNLDAL